MGHDSPLLRLENFLAKIKVLGPHLAKGHVIKKRCHVVDSPKVGIIEIFKYFRSDQSAAHAEPRTLEHFANLPLPARSLGIAPKYERLGPVHLQAINATDQSYVAPVLHNEHQFAQRVRR